MINTWYSVREMALLLLARLPFIGTERVGDNAFHHVTAPCWNTLV